MVLEFLNNFGPLFDIKEVISGGVTFGESKCSGTGRGRGEGRKEGRKEGGCGLMSFTLNFLTCFH